MCWPWDEGSGGGGLFSGVGARVGSGFAVGVTGGGWPFVFAVCVVSRGFRASVRWWGLGGGLWWLCGRMVGSGAAGLAFLGLSKGCLVVFSPFRAVGATRLLRLILQISFSGSSLVVSILDIVYAV